MRRRLLLVASSASHCSESRLRANLCRLLPQIACGWVARCGPLRLAWASATASPPWKIALPRREVCWLAASHVPGVRLRHWKVHRRETRHDCTQDIAWSRGRGCTRRRDAGRCCIRPGGLLEPHLRGEGHRTATGNGRNRSARRLAPRSRGQAWTRIHPLVAGAQQGYLLPQTGGLELELRRQGSPLQLRRFPIGIKGRGAGPLPGLSVSWRGFPPS